MDHSTQTPLPSKMKVLYLVLVAVAFLACAMPTEAAKAHPMTNKILSGFARSFWGDETGKQIMLSGKAPCIGCTLGMNPFLACGVCGEG